MWSKKSAVLLGSLPPEDVSQDGQSAALIDIEQNAFRAELLPQADWEFHEEQIVSVSIHARVRDKKLA